MSKCAHCRQRKAKRACPARRDSLCPLCCGRLRNRELRCPPSCRHWGEHAPYQEQRVLDRKTDSPARPRQGQDDPLTDERLAWLAVQAETPLRELAARRPDITDGVIILAFEYAKDKVERGRGLLVVPGMERRGGNDLGEAIFQSLESCRFERSIVLTTGSEGYSSAEKIHVLDRLILAAKSVARDDFKGRTYIDRVLASFARMDEGSPDANRITLLGT